MKTTTRSFIGMTVNFTVLQKHKNKLLLNERPTESGNKNCREITSALEPQNILKKAGSKEI